MILLQLFCNQAFPPTNWTTHQFMGCFANTQLFLVALPKGTRCTVALVVCMSPTLGPFANFQRLFQSLGWD